MCRFTVFSFILKSRAKVESNSNEEDVNDEDSIVLEGCNQITKWRFPKDIKTCPMLRCDFSFSTHSACRNHFKKVHAKHSICCPECKKPYVAYKPHNFILHFQKAHPKTRMPFHFDDASSSTANNSHDGGKSKTVHDDDDDLITLRACGHITKWRMPADMLKCPVLNCQQVFKQHLSLVTHYKENHADGSLLCALCDKPLRVYAGGNDYIKHYQIKHPNHKIPFEFVKQRNRTKKIIRPNPVVCFPINWLIKSLFQLLN